MEEKDMRICPVCGKEVERNDMNFTRDCHGITFRLVCKGFYEGVNLAMCYCEDCGYQQVEMDTCPKCGSKMITKIDRMNGYLGFTRVHGQTRYNEAKNAEIKDRVSM